MICFIWCYDSLKSPTVEQDNISLCSDCGGVDLLHDAETGELVCKSCGMVISSRLFDTGPEWRAFNLVEKERRPRTGSPLTFTIPDKGLSTSIDWRNLDASGRRLSPETSNKLYRLRRWQRRSTVSDSRNRNLSQALSEMTKVHSKLNLPKNIIETGSLLYRRALGANLIRGRSIDSFVVACLYMACRQCGVIRTFEDIVEAYDVSVWNVARSYRFLLKELNPSVPPVDPVDYVGRLVSKLGLAGETERLAKMVLRQASMMRLTGGRGPAGMAAASVYICTRLTGDHRTQEDIAREAQVTEVTIRNRYKELMKLMELEILV